MEVKDIFMKINYQWENFVINKQSYHYVVINLQAENMKEEILERNSILIQEMRRFEKENFRWGTGFQSYQIILPCFALQEKYFIEDLMIRAFRCLNYLIFKD